MAGFIPEDLQEEVAPLENFTPEAGVDVTRTPQVMAEDLASVSEEPVDVEAKTKELEEAEKSEDNLLGVQS